MQLKKLLQGSAFALVAAACAIAVPSVVKAADGAFADAGIGEVKVYGASAYMTVKAADNNTKEVQVGIGKTNKKGAITVATWQNYEITDTTTNAVKIDLSKLNSKKDNYIVLTTPGKADVSIVKIPANAKAVKAKYDVAKSVLTAASGDKVSNSSLAALTTETGKNYEYRTAFGGWKDVVSGTTPALEDFTFYQDNGANLFVRKKSDVKITNSAEAPDALAAADQQSESYTYGTSTTKSKVYKACTLPSAEAKVVIPARAKAPKTVADYVNGSVKFPKKSEYRVLIPGGTGADKFVYSKDATKEAFESPEKATTKELADKVKGSGTAPTEFYLEVRTKATDKKAASSWSSLKIETPANLAPSTNPLLSDADSSKKRTEFDIGTTNPAKTSATDCTLKAQSKDNELKSPGTGGLKRAKMVEKASDGTLGTSNVLSVDYVKVGNKDLGYYEANAVKIQNSGKMTYEVVKNASKPDATTKGTVIKPGKTVTIKDVKDGEKFFIRIVGDKKTQTWTSDYAEYGVADFPVTIPQLPAANS